MFIYLSFYFSELQIKKKLLATKQKLFISLEILNTKTYTLTAFEVLVNITY